LIVTNISVHSRGVPESTEAPSLAEAFDASGSDLLARMSHEMRTPLGAMLGFAQLLESGTPPPTASQRRSIELILQAGWHLDQLIDMTLDLALLRSGTCSMSLDPVPLAAVMQHCQAMIGSAAQQRGVRVTFPHVEGPCLVLADRVRLQQALGNLLATAIEYSEVDGAVVVECNDQDREWIRIVIRHGDEEAGMEEMGIRVLLARHLIESMGGAMRAENPVGTKGLFWLELKSAVVNGSATSSANASTE
jgi:signal transduction histidine kinase